jgi:hypothetical protein
MAEDTNDILRQSMRPSHGHTHRHVWCGACETIRPLVIADRHADDASRAYT